MYNHKNDRGSQPIHSDEFILKQMGDILILIQQWRLGSYGPLGM